jgi:Kef-type K+ transport system membrane component KefB
MSNELFTEISIIIAIGSVVAFVMHLLRQPLIIGHIITGVIVGPTLFDIVHSEELVDVFSKIGIALLLFIIGLGLNLKVIKELGKVAIFVGLIQVSVTMLIGSLFASVLGYSTFSSLIIGLALAFSSTIIILKLLSDKKEQHRLHGRIAIGVLLFQDLLATLALLAAAAMTKEGLTIEQLVNLSSKGILLVGGLVLLSGYVIPRFNRLISDSQEFLFLFAIGWGLGVASLFEINGFSIEIGALLAGVALGHMPYAQEVGSRLRPLRDFFIVLFFISLGLILNLNSLDGVWVPVILFSFTVLLLKPLIILLTLGFLGYTKNTSFKTAISMAQISEFSLVFIILLNQNGRIDDTLLTILTLVSIITIGISSYLIIYSDSLYHLLEKHLTLFERRKVHYDQKQASNYQLVLFGYDRGGSEFTKVFKSLKKSFVVVDYDPDVIDKIERRKHHYLYGDATDPELLDEVGVDKSKLIVSTITDHEINKFIVTHVHALNPKAVLIASAESPEAATDLYNHGASYVMMPHFIGSEKIGSFIKRNGFKRSAFKQWREKHILSLQEHAAHIQDTSSKNDV